MMKTTTLQGMYDHIGKRWKAMSFAFLLMCSISLINTIQSQTPADLGEEVSSEVSKLLQEERAALLHEQRTPPTGVKVDNNDEIAAMYLRVKRGFASGNALDKEFVRALKGVVRSSSTTSSSVLHSSGSNIDLTQGQKVELREVIGFINSWDVGSKDLTDLEELFTLIRELKNQ